MGNESGRRYLEPEDLNIRYLNPVPPTKEEQLAIKTCPGYSQALDRALNDYYREKRCGDCHVLSAEIIAGVARINIRGLCPKI